MRNNTGKIIDGGNMTREICRNCKHSSRVSWAPKYASEYHCCIDSFGKPSIMPVDVQPDYVCERFDYHYRFVESTPLFSRKRRNTTEN